MNTILIIIVKPRTVIRLLIQNQVIVNTGVIQETNVHFIVIVILSLTVSVIVKVYYIKKY